jgi:hypothetical protein
MKDTVALVATFIHNNINHDIHDTLHLPQECPNKKYNH